MRRCWTVPAFQSGLMWWNMSSASPLSFLAPNPLSVITQKVPSGIALMPEKPCIGWPLNGVETPVRRGADWGEMYDVPGMVPIASTRRHSGPVYLPAIANDFGRILRRIQRDRQSRQHGMAGERRRKLLLGGSIERSGERYGEQCAEPIHGVPPMIDPRGQQAADELAGRIDRGLLRVRRQRPRAAAPPRRAMNSRRRMGSIRASQEGCGNTIRP